MPSTPTTSASILRDAWRRWGAEAEVGGRFLASLTPAEVERLATDWGLFARPDQWPPAGAGWTTWLLMGGRGAGKTRAGAEWLRGQALGTPGLAPAPLSPLALVGETFAAVREVMVEGVSGLMALHPRGERPTWEVGRRRLVWPNGAVAQAFSAEEPESLRGPQFAAAWCDEIGKWPHGEAVWDNLQFALRLGARPRQVATTTPRPTALIRRLLAAPTTAVSRAPTVANAYNLAPSFLTEVVGRYAGTRLGRQELEGELIDDRPDAFWRRPALEALRIGQAPTDLARIVVAVDPPAGSGRSSRCGIVAAGRRMDGGLVVLADATVEGATPEQWGARAIALYHALAADALVAEVNQGGAMVAAVLAALDPTVPVTAVRATRGKHRRAEPVAALYVQGRVRHAGVFAALEDEMCAFGPDGLADGRSPDRLDALVWALTALLAEARPRVRDL